MNAPTPSTTPEKSLPVHSDVAEEIRKLAEENILKRPPQIETEVERIRSSITQLERIPLILKRSLHGGKS